MLETDFCGFKMKNPIVTASGTFGFGEEFSKFYDLSLLGGICSKGLTFEPRKGNLGTRMHETPSGMLNSVGLQNPGIGHFIKVELPFMRRFDTLVIANMGGGSEEEYIKGAAALNSADIDILELNISCPNVKEGGAAFGIKAHIAADIVKKVRAVYTGVLMVKLSPNAEDIAEMAKACEAAGADALSLVNTFKAMAIDVYAKKPFFRNTVAGLSGPAIKPIALRMVYEVSRSVGIPVMGLGGITTWRDAVEFLLAGAAAVQVGTGNFIKPDIPLDIISGIEDYLKKEGAASVKDIIGACS